MRLALCLVAAAAGVGLAVGTAGATASPALAGSGRYVAMGSSYAAGPGIAPSPGACGRSGLQLFVADQANSRYAIQIPRKPPIMKNTTAESDNCPAPQRLGMKLAMKPPTDPPMYVGPLRTNPSSVNSTAGTINCGAYGQRDRSRVCGVTKATFTTLRPDPRSCPRRAGGVD